MNIKSMCMRMIAIVLLFIVPFSVTGCNSADITKVVAEIASNIPTAIALAQSILAIVNLAGGAQAQGIVVPVDKLNALKQLCDDYTANPKADTWHEIIALVDELVTDGDSALLTALSIKDPATQQKATAVLGALSAVLHIIDGYVQQTQPASAVKATAAKRKVKLARISQYWSVQDKKNIESSFNKTYPEIMQLETSMGF